MRRNDATPSIREDLAGHLGDGLEALEPALDPALSPEVRPIARTLTGDLPSPVVDVQLTSLAPGKTSGTRRLHTLFVDVVWNRQADDTGLDDLASAVLDVLTACPSTHWTTAQWVIRDNLFPAVRITVEMENK